MPNDQQPGRLKRELGVFHAVLLGLGSILGTGVFVSIGIAAGIAGPSVLIAIVLAALLALCNGLSSAQLAAAHPVAGGTYEYGYKYLHPKLGFTAGWMFLLAKSASAATAALAIASYLFWYFIVHADPIKELIGQGVNPQNMTTLIACLGIIFVTVLVIFGIRRASWVNSLLLLITFSGVCSFLAFCFSEADRGLSEDEIVQGLWRGTLDLPDLFFATAFLFVAYTGYGRIATLGEEVHSPRKTIPRAILCTLLITACLYSLVGLCLIVGIGPIEHNNEWAGMAFADVVRVNEGPRFLLDFVIIAAITAMLGVLLNLVLGLSRVLLAMGRRHDVPGFFKSVNASGTTPVPAVIGVGVLIAGLTLIGDVKTTWTFSAFTVLIYYGITNLAALRLPQENRLYPRVFSWAGLGGCLFLCWWVEPIVWMIGLGLIVLGLVWHGLAPKLFGVPPRPNEVCAQCGYDLRASAGNCPECGAAIPDGKETAASPRGGRALTNSES